MGYVLYVVTWCMAEYFCIVNNRAIDGVCIIHCLVCMCCAYRKLGLGRQFSVNHDDVKRVY